MGAYLAGAIDPLEGRVHLTLIDSTRGDVIAAASDESPQPAVADVAERLVKAMTPGSPVDVVLLPTRDATRLVSNLGTVALDIQLATALATSARSRSWGVRLRPRQGVLEVLRAEGLSMDRALSESGARLLRRAFHAQAAVLATYDAGKEALRATIVDLRDARSLNVVEERVLLHGYAVGRDAARFTVDEASLAALDLDLEVAQNVARTVKDAGLKLYQKDPAGAATILEKLRDRGGPYARSTDLLLLLACARAGEGNVEKATALFEEVLTLAPGDPGARQAYSDFLLDEAERLSLAARRRFWFDDRELLAKAREAARRGGELAVMEHQVERARRLAADE